MSIPEQFAGRGDSFVLQVRGDSMVDAGILSGDYVVVERQTDGHATAKSSWRASRATKPR